MTQSPLVGTNIVLVGGCGMQVFKNTVVPVRGIAQPLKNTISSPKGRGDDASLVIAFAVYLTCSIVGDYNVLRACAHRLAQDDELLITCSVF